MLVLHVFDHTIPLHSGYTFRSLAILRQQHALGIKTIHVSSAKQLEQKQKQEQVDDLLFYRTFGGTLSKVPVLNQWDVIRSLSKRIEEVVLEQRPQVIHAHSPSLNAIAASSVAKKYNIPLVYEVRASWEDAAVSHGTCREGSLRYKVGQWLERTALHRANHVTTICHGLSDYIHHWGISRKNITIIPNAVDITKFNIIKSKDAELIEQWGLEGKTVLGFLGSFYRYEGLHLLLDAMPAILAKNPQAHLLLVGGGPQLEQLQQQVETLKLSSAVTFIGRVNHHDISRYYSLVDLFVYPRESIRLTEMVTPLKPLEAMAQQGLVVASDIGGHREMIENDVTGVLFKPDDPNAISQAINRLIADKSCWPALKQSGYDYVKAQRSWQFSVEPIVNVYDELTREP
ncbi:TIGR04063 family PEP-CTERM/XrtA system glycosyltransferase [Psychrobium sp. 1_MG-2023]|uniref:TIGR04063 family PEP-CTERM/XrtA system glycosyltransferase n=1 Tax=Psychrobium sp. 1_MG-2023 TaxID=3062624 RepID=UPI000C339166|nr:TIGR04063 family PEP-CTERM/XrtA system glycosyltransferase [Psychrobium sp. 1_MG-2023]MDP2561131.1 glycosyltransferase, exosortase A system-associated [Psychrobium sp. 1_MG-2023]PKF55107.1 glycosyltransferase, exosortase A system-associated [Alteromonadales bacterium alter-6D02]